jgi:membrane-associated protease RseP (regulator of RpoE activity)
MDTDPACQVSKDDLPYCVTQSYLQTIAIITRSALCFVEEALGLGRPIPPFRIHAAMEGSRWCAANYVPLTPLSFLERAALVFGDRAAIIFGDKQFSWRETRERCHAGASVLANLGVCRRDVVSDRSLTSQFILLFMLCQTQHD